MFQLTDKKKRIMPSLIIKMMSACNFFAIYSQWVINSIRLKIYLILTLVSMLNSLKKVIRWSPSPFKIVWLFISFAVHKYFCKNITLCKNDALQKFCHTNVTLCKKWQRAKFLTFKNIAVQKCPLVQKWHPPINV